MNHWRLGARIRRAAVPARGTALWLAVLIAFAVGPAADSSSADDANSEAQPSLSDINKKLTNPVSDLWSITFQQNNYRIDLAPGISERWNSNLNFQPVLPIALTDDWNLITRPVITLVNSVPHPDPGVIPLDIDRTTGFGDSVLLEMFSPSPKIAGDWLFGFGPTFIFPTASSKWTGQQKWQAGPAALVGYLAPKWIAGAFFQQWMSFAGKSSREATSQMNLQPIASYFLPNGWSIGYSGNILANWKASGDEVWTVPVGLSVAKVLKIGKLPLRIGVGGQYMPIRPDLFGQKWNLQITLAPVIPKLVRGNLADPSSLQFGMPK
jgi:hypothetical protein